MKEFVPKSETFQKTPPTALQITLGKPALHLALGLLLLLVWTWPFLNFTSHIYVWLFLYGTWGISLVIAGALSFGRHPLREDNV